VKLSEVSRYLAQSFNNALEPFVALFVLWQLDNIKLLQDPREITRLKQLTPSN
jgi:hypothetical protein